MKTDKKRARIFKLLRSPGRLRFLLSTLGNGVILAKSSTGKDLKRVSQ
jgi:hypothetical protein